MYVKTLLPIHDCKDFKYVHLKKIMLSKLFVMTVLLFVFFGSSKPKDKARQQNKSNSEERREPSMSNSDEWRQMEEAAAEASQATRDGQLFGLGNSR